MPRDGYATEVARITELMPRVLDHVAPPERGGSLPTQYILVINGRVPWGERTRASPAACRSALRRLLRRRLQELIHAPSRRADPPMSWQEWRRYEGPALERVIKQLERDGIVEYRASNFNQTTTGLTS